MQIYLTDNMLRILFHLLQLQLLIILMMQQLQLQQEMRLTVVEHLPLTKLSIQRLQLITLIQVLKQVY